MTKDVVIPGQVDYWRAAELRRQNLPHAERDVLIAFHGRHFGNTESLKKQKHQKRTLEKHTHIKIQGET